MRVRAPLEAHRDDLAPLFCEACEKVFLPLRELVVADAAQHDDELVSALAKHVARAELGGQPARHEAQDLVASVMALGVVDLFEAVDVDEHDSSLGCGIREPARDGRRRFSPSRRTARTAASTSSENSDSLNRRIC